MKQKFQAFINLSQGHILNFGNFSLFAEFMSEYRFCPI